MKLRVLIVAVSACCFAAHFFAQDASLSPEALYSRGLARTIPPNVDLAEAANLFRQAAERGLPRAQRSLGELYLAGQGVPKDEAEALKWFRKAAEKGDAKAQSNLGSMYVGGQGGLKKDEKEAIKWFKKAADKDDIAGQLSLAAIYITKDSREAVKWFRKAAEQGSALAQFTLGSIYDGGRLYGITPNRAEAVVWYTKALQQGFEEARKPLAALQNLHIIPPDEAAANLLVKMTRIDPPLAKAARINDFVSVEIVVGAAGNVKSYKILHGHPLLNESAIQAIAPLRYKPFLVNGQPAEIITTITLTYAF